MKTAFASTCKLVALAAMLAASSTASAQAARSWSAAIGLNKISPDVTSGTSTAPTIPNVKNGVASDTQPLVTVTYMWTDHIGLATFIGTPYKHDQLGAGALQGAGKLGTVKALPATLLLQYHFLEPKAKFRPYIGAGITYGYFFDERGSGALTALTNTGSSKPTTFEAESAWGSTIKVGATFAINEKWFATASVSKTWLKTTSRFSTGQTLSMKLDPMAYGVGVGYHF